MVTSTAVQQVQVTCRRMSQSNGSHEHITHLGGTNWIWTKEQIIADLESPSPRNSFYTSVGGHKAWVGVVTTSTGFKYLRTYANGAWNDNLLALGICL